jgi:WG containing repeat
MITSQQNIAIAKVKPNWNFWGLINTRGEYIVEPIYPTIYDWKDGIALLEKVPSKIDVGGKWTNHYNGQYGFVRSTGKFITDFSFGYANSFYGGFAAVNKNKKWGFIDTSGSLTIPFKFDNIRQFQREGCIVLADNGWGLIDRKGNWVLNNVFENLFSFSFGLAVAEISSGFLFKQSHKFIINSNGDKIVDLPKEWDWFQPVSEKLILIGTSSDYPGRRTFGFMDLTGKIVTQPQFYADSDNLFDVGEFCDDMLQVRNKQGLYGFVNIYGELTIPLQFHSANYFNNGIAKVSINDEIFFIDKSGTKISYEEPGELKRPFDEILDFSEGLAAARKVNLWGIIDDNNNVVVDFKFGRRVFRTENDSGLFFSEYNPQYSCGLIGINEEKGNDIYAGYLGSKGEIAIDLKYKVAEPFILA